MANDKLRKAVGVLMFALPVGLAGAAENSGQPQHQVTMTWVSGQHRYATVDGRLCGVGHLLSDGVKVAAIDQGAVTFSKDGKTWRVVMVKSPPDSDANSAGSRRNALVAYLDQAIRQLDRAITRRKAIEGESGALQKIETLRKKLVTAKDNLVNGRLGDKERRQLAAEFGADWLRKQKTLDLLRGDILNSDGGPGSKDLESIQKALEARAMADLRKPLEQYQQLTGAKFDLDGGNANLAKQAMTLLDSYPDYQALADKLEQVQKEYRQ